MIKRFGRKEAIRSLIRPILIYTPISFALLWLFHPYLLTLKGGTLFGIAVIGFWRYGLAVVHYVRALWYRLRHYPSYLLEIEKLDIEHRFPHTIYFVIPSYKEEPWISTEIFQALLNDLSLLPCRAVLIVSTGSDRDDAVISDIYNATCRQERTKIIFQRQTQGKRIAMGHALRTLSREYHKTDHAGDSVTVFMDGDSYLPLGTMAASLPFFKINPTLGALTTNEIAYIDSRSRWYKDWFNLKFAQRHIHFQSQSLSKRVMTLTGRFSLFRTSIVIEEAFISLIENDTIVDPNYGKFRFLMGDDKSSWYYLMKQGWEMLYLPNVLIYSLESRDGDFFELSNSLPYRWYGNTLRNNARAQKLRGQPLFIRYLLFDQIALMWTSLVGIGATLILSLFVHWAYLPLYLAWVIQVRLLQMGAFALGGHPVSVRTPILMLYSQWIGAMIKIRAYYHLSDQKWSKSPNEVQDASHLVATISHRFAPYYSSFRMYLAVAFFIFCLALLIAKIITFPDWHFFIIKEA